ncbi:M20 family metallopeptidase [Sutterella sp.]|uniref:M20 family metallopeptidase n=1 Tax=Sutterella sp. TaxID=1981025 RepID=UPI003FD7CD67
MLEAYLADLKEVVDLDCGSGNCAGVTRVAEIMKRHYESIGFTAELVDVGHKAGRGLFATNKPGAETFDIMFNAHLDTVYPDGTAAAQPFRIEDGRVYGPGCADCKAGVIAIYHALKNARKEDLDRLAVAVVYNPDEEVSSLSSRPWLAAMAKKCRRVVVSEPGRASGAFVRSRKGRSVWSVTVHGVAAHAGNNPQDGRSAILAAARFTIAVSALQDYEGKGTSVTVGVISGGTVCNTIPAECTMKIDTRFKRDEDGRAIDEGIEKLAREDWGDGITVEAVRVSSSPAMPCTDAAKALAGLIDEAARLEGFKATWVDSGGGSDANRIAQTGTPVVDGVAPAGGCFHAAEKEYLLVDTIESRVRMLSRLLTLI